jgi:hypothetical protein
MATSETLEGHEFNSHGREFGEKPHPHLPLSTQEHK